MYSLEHKLFLKKNKRYNFLVRLSQLAIIVLFIVIWQILADLEIINTFIFSSPKKVLNCFIGLHNGGSLYKHIGITIFETVLSFGLGTLIGLVIATIMWRIKFFAKVIDPYLTILNSLPKVALGPIIIIWAGAGMKSIILMALLISVIVTIINLYQGFLDTDPNKIKLMQSFNANNGQIYFKLIIPSSIKVFISTLKINISMSLIGVIMGELLVSKQGLGYLIMYGSQVFNINLVITSVFLLGLLSYLMYFSISKLDHLFKK